jgi:hypothetical protein
MIDPRAHGITAHQPGIAGSQQFGRCGWDYGWKDLSGRHQERESMGQRHLSESGVVRGKKLL